jgi:hypothetical protein
MSDVTPIRVGLPAPIADALVASGEAVRSFTTRGSAAIEILNFTIEGINTGAAIVTLVGGAELYRKLARQLREHAGDRTIVAEMTAGQKEVMPLVPEKGAPVLASAAADSPASEPEDTIVAALLANAQSQSGNAKSQS